MIFGDGEQSRDFTYVANVVAGEHAGDGAPDVAGSVYNVACGERVTLNRLVAELRDLLGADVEPVYAAPRPGDIRHSLADLDAARGGARLRARRRLREGLRADDRALPRRGAPETATADGECHDERRDSARRRLRRRGGGVVRATPVAIRIARATGFLDRPREYRRHAAPTPFLGGAAVLVAFLVAALIVGGAAGSLLVAARRGGA